VKVLQECHAAVLDLWYQGIYSHQNNSKDDGNSTNVFSVFTEIRVALTSPFLGVFVSRYLSP